MRRIRVEQAGAVGRIVLARPEKKNALDRQMAEELLEALTRFADDASVRAVALTADGGDFCAGADLEALAGMVGEPSEVHMRDADALGRVFITLRHMDKPTVAAVRGRALAGGAGLATACDLVVAHEGAQFGYPEVRVGFVPAMVMTMLRRCVGEKAAFELVATGRTIGAREALELGLVTRIAADAEFDEAVRATLSSLASVHPAALALTKRLFYDLDGLSFREGIALGADVNVRSRSTDAFREGVERFVQRSGQSRGTV
ncbi:MAG: enoyl-CoA hydratase/isomerase family protein [Chloroflexota bacterium]|nr:enoyl-CoA hydratase/isomerase family protein [Chloroflexota bacterium]